MSFKAHRRSAAAPSSPDEISNDCFRAVANYTYDWESWHAADGKLLWVNPAVERITGYRPDECLRMADYPLPMVAPEDRECFAVVLDEAKQGTSGNDVEFRSVHRDGTVRWMAVSWQPMYDDAGTHLGFRASVRDITERHQLREQLRLHAEHLEQLVQERTARITQLERHRREMEKLAALGQLAAGVAHEVNNPLAGIRNAFALFKSEIPPDHEQFELLELIDREIDRISRITHQMHQLYRPSHQQPDCFPLERTAEEVACLLEPAAKKAGVRIEVGPQDPVTEVTLPEGEVKQILFNLIRNAIEASPRGSVVKVWVERDADHCTVSVIDPGRGIADDVLPRIFDPFFTTKGTQPSGGMGLGLSVTWSLIEAMGGSIEVDTSPNEGSRFTAVFPIRGADRVRGSDE